MPNIDLVQGYNSYRSLTNTTFKTPLVKEEGEIVSKKESVSRASWTDVVDIGAKTYDFDFSGKGKLSVVFDERSSKVAAFFTTEYGDIKQVKAEDIPSDIRDIPNVKALEAYLSQSNIRIVTLSNGDIKFYCNLGLKGGGQSEQNIMIWEFSRGYVMDEFNTKFLLNKIRTDLKEEPTYASKETVKNLYTAWFTKNYCMDAFNTQFLAQRCSEIFDGVTVTTPPTPPTVKSVAAPIISTQLVSQSSVVIPDSQETQGKAIADYLKVHGNNMNDYNTGYLLNNVLCGKATALSKQIIKTHYINFFIKQCGDMNESNTKAAISHSTSIFKESLGNEPARQILKSAYIAYFIKKFEMSESNTSTAVAHCISMGLPFISNNEPAATMLKSAYISWFTGKFAMDEANIQVAMKGLTKLGFQLVKEPAKILLETAYVAWFKDNFGKDGLDSTNRQILKDRYQSLFGETLEHVYTDPYKALSSGNFTSRDSDIQGYAKEMIAGVAAGAPILEEYYISDQGKSDAITKDLLLNGCIANLMPPYTEDQIITAGVIAYGIKKGWYSALKGLVGEAAILCAGGVWAKAKGNLRECGDLVCESKSNGGSGGSVRNELSDNGSGIKFRGGSSYNSITGKYDKTGNGGPAIPK